LHGSRPSHAISNDGDHLLLSMTAIIDHIYIASHSSAQALN
jgi:hypothetical protein